MCFISDWCDPPMDYAERQAREAKSKRIIQRFEGEEGNDQLTCIGKFVRAFFIRRSVIESDQDLLHMSNKEFKQFEIVATAIIVVIAVLALTAILYIMISNLWYIPINDK